MKTILTVILALFLFVSLSWASDRGDGLTELGSPKVESSAGEMIALGIPPDDTLRVSRVMLKYRFQDEDVLKVHRSIIAARKQGLPLRPLINKVFEGIAKRVDVPRIVMAVEKVRSRYAFSYDQIETLSREQAQKDLMGNTLAAGLAAGLSEEDARAVVKALHQRADPARGIEVNSLIVESLKTARDMARIGVSSEAISDLVSKALEKGYDHEEMRIMRESLISHSRELPVNKLVKGYAKAIEDGRNAGSLGPPKGGEGKEPGIPGQPGGPGGVGAPGSAGGEGDPGGGGAGGSGGPGGPGGGGDGSAGSAGGPGGGGNGR